MDILVTIDGRKIRGSRFRELSNAINSLDHAVKPMLVMLGDNDGENYEFWVVTPADAQRLERAGYEYA
ncbi:MAG: hypothetical protein HJJLKODD_02683 [Phycisphaerae bacterium]|nr:hypothetical protein [Phycisphaerae bacterium]